MNYDYESEMHSDTCARTGVWAEASRSYVCPFRQNSVLRGVTQWEVLLNEPLQIPTDHTVKATVILKA